MYSLDIFVTRDVFRLGRNRRLSFLVVRVYLEGLIGFTDHRNFTKALSPVFLILIVYKLQFFSKPFVGITATIVFCSSRCVLSTGCLISYTNIPGDDGTRDANVFG